MSAIVMPALAAVPARCFMPASATVPTAAAMPAAASMPTAATVPAAAMLAAAMLAAAMLAAAMLAAAMAAFAPVLRLGWTGCRDHQCRRGRDQQLRPHGLALHRLRPRRSRVL
jgi:hypothetical protein